eukprot:GHVU01236309.1.p1 GENE.GHVU01236309.1~~GHVU01236309.1.p1  ORF type:complete len:146 (-),score=13.46 GHVU01236309.1:157-594(-)
MKKNKILKNSIIGLASAAAIATTGFAIMSSTQANNIESIQGQNSNFSINQTNSDRTVTKTHSIKYSHNGVNYTGKLTTTFRYVRASGTEVGRKIASRVNRFSDIKFSHDTKDATKPNMGVKLYFSDPTKNNHVSVDLPDIKDTTA